MIRLIILTLALAAAGISPAQAQSDRRVTTLSWRAGQALVLPSMVGNTVTLIFAPGERVLGFEVADPAALEVALAPAGDSLIVKTLRNSDGPLLTVRTTLHDYAFAVRLGAPEDAAYVVRFADAALPALQTAAKAPVASGGNYKLSGTKALQPVRIDDDGVRTFIEWGPDQLLPAVFALNELGGEEMVDGYMREGIYTIDRVHLRLLFRIDKKWAKAERLGPAKARK
jgi:type IV secretion system protein VirB9